MESVDMESSYEHLVDNDFANSSERYYRDFETTNGYVNVSESDIRHIKQHQLINKVLEIYFLPVICLLGFIGNTISTTVFLQKSLRNSSCSIFLATRGISDNGFLLTLLLIWMSSTFDLQLSQVRGICQMLVFLTYVCGCISVWLVVFVTAENYIRICRPFIVSRVCKTTTAKIIVFILIVVVLCLYNFPFWTTTPDCIPSADHYSTIQAMVYMDTVITLVLPTLLISVLLFVIVINVIKAYNRRGRLSAPTVKHVKNPMAKVTKMLIAVSVTFFCLNLPSHVIRLRLMIVSFLNGYATVSQMEATMQKVTLFIYYLSLSINLIVYCSFGSKFRKVFRQTFKVFFPADSSVTTSALLEREDKDSRSNMNTLNTTNVLLQKRSVTVMYDKDTTTCITTAMEPLNGSQNV